MPTVEHIANVSFKDHFLSAQEAAPKNVSIQVNKNTFDVTFVDGKVNAKFTSGNWFSNFFRSSTLARFTRRSRSNTTHGLLSRRRSVASRTTPTSRP